MHPTAINHARLMRESTDRVQSALYSKNSQEQLIACRVLENPATWQSWEIEHSQLMRRVADCGKLADQGTALKHATFHLIHRKALFEYLRDRGIPETERPRVFAHFRMAQPYEHAVIAEHRIYLRKACSFLCASHVGCDVLRDAGFLDPIPRYEVLYAEYFELYCRSYCRGEDEDSEAELALLPLLKRQLNEWRQAILNPRAELPRLLRDAELRRPTGDTQRNRILGGASIRGGAKIRRN